MRSKLKILGTNLKCYAIMAAFLAAGTMLCSAFVGAKIGVPQTLRDNQIVISEGVVHLMHFESEPGSKQRRIDIDVMEHSGATVIGAVQMLMVLTWVGSFLGWIPIVWICDLTFGWSPAVYGKTEVVLESRAVQPPHTSGI